jgi:tetratricopeptide (TPR) repeat protein
MRSLLLLLLLLAFSFGDTIHRVARINTYAEEAAQAYNSRNYLHAISAYAYLLDSLQLKDDKMRLNLAHAYFRSGDLSNARLRYEGLSRHPDRLLRSVACQQLGTLHARQKEWQPALDFYRQALVANVGNQQARHNYELVKKYLLLNPQEMPADEEAPAPKPEASQPPPAPGAGGPGGQDPGSGGTAANQPGQGANGPDASSGGNRTETGEDNRRPENPEGPDQQEGVTGTEPGESQGMSPAPEPAAPPAQTGRGGTENISDKDQQAQTIQRLRQMNLSPEKAQMLLEALRQAEIQHIQQLPRQPGKPKDPTKPEW